MGFIEGYSRGMSYNSVPTCVEVTCITIIDTVIQHIHTKYTLTTPIYSIHIHLVVGEIRAEAKARGGAFDPGRCRVRPSVTCITIIDTIIMHMYTNDTY
jgi:hypothetical protein